MSLRFCRGYTRSLFTVFNTAVLYIAGCGKLRGLDSNGENAEWLGGKPVKKKRKGLDFLLEKEISPAFLPKTLHGKCREIHHV